ncbi:branched-chain amino acid ABC transporter permease [Algihabitans albus]|uniref:branched-chain amino acid ABC transporter permease n=1 Tax=Algihabitans albus TaxID=2164067 RepID=UPI001ABC498D|nr:branched-chain amino acid ABC transporter permease [Algihabitans albus]
MIPIVEWGLLIFLLIYPFAVSFLTAGDSAPDFNNFWVIRVTTMLILAKLAISFDLCWGYSGIMSFGQGLFFGLAGYVVAKFAEELGWLQIFFVVPMGMLVGLLAALLVGWFLLLGKRTPTVIFVALGTLTASYAAERLVAGWLWVGAGNGLSIWDFLMIGSYELEPGLIFYYVALLFLCLVYLGSRYLVRSQFGLVLAGMRQNEERIAFFGYRVQIYKAIVFSFAGMVAGLAGALYSYHEGFVGPSSVGIGISTYAVLYGLFGGIGTLIGPVIGAGVIEILRLFLSDIDAIRNYWPVVLGIIMLVVVAYRPTGLLGLIVSERERIGSFGIAVRGKAAKETPPARPERTEGDDGAA